MLSEQAHRGGRHSRGNFPKMLGVREMSQDQIAQLQINAGHKYVRNPAQPFAPPRFPVSEHEPVGQQHDGKADGHFLEEERQEEERMPPAGATPNAAAAISRRRRKITNARM